MMASFSRGETGRLSVGTEHLPDEYPYVRAGEGSRPLVVIPGIDDAMFPGVYPRTAVPPFRAYVRRYLPDRTVYLVSRPRGLPAEASIPSIARGYADVLDRELGEVDVLGISMGGMIGLSLARQRPDLVGDLVVANSGAHTAEEGRTASRRWKRLARRRDWGTIRAELSTGMFTGWRAVTYPPAAATVGRLVAPRPADPEDVAVSLDAIRGFDASDRLEEIPTRTLVVGGDEDPYFPPAILRATAEGVPDGRLALLPGKHAAFHERKPAFDDRVTDFLGVGSASDEP